MDYDAPKQHTALKIVVGAALAIAIGALVVYMVNREVQKNKAKKRAKQFIAQTAATGTIGVPQGTEPVESIIPSDAEDVDGVDIPIEYPPDFISTNQIAGKSWASEPAALDQMYGFFNLDGSNSDPDAADSEEEIMKQKEQVARGMRSSFRDGVEDIVNTNGVRVPTLDGSRWAQANERLLAIRDGIGERRRTRVVGLYTDLRPRPAVPATNNVNRLNLFDISESQSLWDGVLPPGGELFNSIIDPAF